MDRRAVCAGAAAIGATLGAAAGYGCGECLDYVINWARELVMGGSYSDSVAGLCAFFGSVGGGLFGYGKGLDLTGESITKEAERRPIYLDFSRFFP